MRCSIFQNTLLVVTFPNNRLRLKKWNGSPLPSFPYALPAKDRTNFFQRGAHPLVSLPSMNGVVRDRVQGFPNRRRRRRQSSQHKVCSSSSTRPTVSTSSSIALKF